MFDLTGDAVPPMQEKDSAIHHIMEWIAILGESKGIIATAVVAVSILPYSKGIFYITVLAIMSYSNAILKILYHDPRPFYVQEEVQPLSCSKSYGNPSGHTMYFTCVFPLLFYLLFHSKVKGYYALSFNDYRHHVDYIIAYIIILLIFIFIAVAAVFGRVYLGVHALNQVLYGALLGLAQFFYIFFIAYLPLQNYIYRFTERRCTTREFFWGILVTSLIITGLLIAAIIAYFITVSVHEDANEWLETIRRRCDIPERDLNDPDMFVRSSLESMFSPAGLFG